MAELATQSSYEIQDPSLSYGDKITFQTLLLACFNRHHYHIINGMNKLEKSQWKEWLVLKTSLGMIHGLISPYYDEEYKAKLDVLQLRLTAPKLYSQDLDYLDALNEWISLMAVRLAVFRLIPPIPVRIRTKTGEVVKV